MDNLRHDLILAMELDRRHIGKLVQIITDSWSMTGTLSRVDQHDNREWSIDYFNGGGLVPSGGEIYSTLTIGPWVGDVIGNQPVTVETVAGTLEAPERAARPRKLAALIVDSSEAVMEGVVVEPEDVDTAKLQDEVRRGERTINSARAALGFPEFSADADDGPRLLHFPSVHGGSRCGAAGEGVFYAAAWDRVTCEECRAFKGWDDLPPEPPAEWSKR